MLFGCSPCVAEAHRQAALIVASEQTAEDQAFVDAIAAPWEA